jgi:adenylate cyclase class 1
MGNPATEEEQGLGRKALQRIVDRFHHLRDERLRRIRRTLSHEQRSFFDLLPLLWHVNHPMLPGFVTSNTPSGVVDFHPTREQLLLARRFVRGFREENRLLYQAPIRGLYLMGSMGSLGQTGGSDMDFWLCHAGDLNDQDLQLLRQKATELEEYAAGIGLHAHFFMMNDTAFREGAHEQLSKESSGHTQHTLLLEEFYRTGLQLAGNPLLWWIVPPEQEADYARYTSELVRKRFIKAEQWLDFGGLHSLPAEEFFGVAHWQLFKGIDAPYKSLLKLMLLEAYAAEYPRVNWLCMDTKRAVYADKDIDIDRVDPYLLILQRITHYLDARGEPDRLQLARRAFYFKAGHQLTRVNAPQDWRSQLMLEQCQGWGWDKAELRLLDTRAEWKLERVVEERNGLVSELSRSYRLLTEFAREQDAAASLDTRELALLGRKLYAVLDKRPGKIDRVNPGISRDLSEKTLWLRRSDDDPVRWQLFLHPPNEMHNTPVKTSISLVEILTWLHLNGVCERSTQIHYLPKPDGYGESEQDKILKTLRKHLPLDKSTDHSLNAYADMARGRLSIWFINVGYNPLASFVEAGYQLISERIDALSFGAAHDCLIGSIEHLYLTTWGEVRIERYADGGDGLLDCVCRYLDLFAPHRHDLESIASFSYSSTRGGAIANRVTRLVYSIAEAFHNNGQNTRYLLRIADQHYQIHRSDERYTWEAVGNDADFTTHLARSHTEFVPTRIDRMSMQNSPLPALLTRNLPHKVQVFYQVRDRGIQLFVFDENGGVFQQWIESADEYYLMVQQQRFLDTIASRRLLASARATADCGAQFARVVETARGDWQITNIRVPRTRITDHAELILAVSAGCRLDDGFRLQLGRKEFESLLLGDALYTEVVRHIRRLRNGHSNYPIYLTGVISAEGDEGGRCPLIDLLRLKQQVEMSLATAMRQLGN